MSAQVDHRASEAGDGERPQDDVRPDAAPADAAPSDTVAEPAEPVDAEPVDAEPVDAEPVDAEPVDAEPMDAAPDEAHAVAVPVEPGPVDPDPLESGPVDRDPAQVGSVEPDTEWESGPVVVQDAPTASPAALRVDFGAHLEANYQRLVAQLYAITLDAGEAHDVVQDAYSRAWRKWAEIGAGPDPTGWVRRVAVRSTQRGWRRVLERVGLARPRPVGDGDARTAALLAALGRLGIAERRVVVLFHMVGMSRRDIAALEQVPAETVALRLRRAHQAVSEGMADELPSVLGVPATYDDPYTPHAGAERQYRWTP